MSIVWPALGSQVDKRWNKGVTFNPHVGFKSCSVNFTALEEPADGVVISSYEEMVRKYVVSVTLFPLVKAIK